MISHRDGQPVTVCDYCFVVAPAATGGNPHVGTERVENVTGWRAEPDAYSDEEWRSADRHACPAHEERIGDPPPTHAKRPLVP